VSRSVKNGAAVVCRSCQTLEHLCTRVRLPSCTTAFERPCAFAFSWSLAAPRSHIQLLQCAMALGGLAYSLSPGLSLHRASTFKCLNALGPRWPSVLAFSCSRATPRCTRQRSAPGQRARHTGLGQFANIRSATPGERHHRLAPRGILEPVLTREANPQERLEPVGSLILLRSGAL